MRPPRAALSAVVQSYNREAIIGTCLRALAFADEVVLVDKSSTDGTVREAARHVDRVVQVPWSPFCEMTRPLALEQCRHDWILLLDDDECLNAEAVLWIDEELRAPRADSYSFPLRHFVLGEHDERAYFWPEHHMRLFRRGEATIGTVVHGGVAAASARTYQVPIETGACIMHLSHQDSAQWIEKTNRYTSQPGRLGRSEAGADLWAFAHARLDHWAAQGKVSGDGYVDAVGVLRAVYDIVDAVKGWEQARPGLDGPGMLARTCRELDESYCERLAGLALPRAGASGAARADATP